MKKQFLILAMALCTVVAMAQDTFFSAPIPDSVFQRMADVSFPVKAAAEAGLKRADLRYVRILHYDFEGQVREGELVCHHSIAADLVDIFRQLYEAKYPIASVRLIDDFGADDERSMQANNTSCFCFRPIQGSTKLSKHAQGLAIDLNPLQNPCVRDRNGRRIVEPSTATPYVNRRRSFAHKINRSDRAYKLFVRHGFQWGGSWRTLKDYQHFEK